MIKMIQKLKKEIPKEILDLMPIGLSHKASREFLFNGAIVAGIVDMPPAAESGESKQKKLKDNIEEPKGLSHYFWR